MADRLRVAVIGAGYFARFQIAAWRQMRQVELVAVAEIDPNRRAEIGQAFSDQHVVPDLNAALALSLDLIDIATPPLTHASLIRQARDQPGGRSAAFICQKPFCETLSEAREVVDDLADTPLFIHENFRFQPWFRKIRRLIDDGALGELVQARFALRPGDGGGPNAYLDRQPYFRDMDRFLIRETGIHFIDTFRYLFGDPAAVYADLRRSNPVIAGEDSGIFIFDLPSGAQITFDANRTLDHAADNHRLTMGEFEVEGTVATLRLSGNGTLSLRRFGGSDWDPVPHMFDPSEFGGGCVPAFQSHVLAALTHSAPAETLARHYLRNLELQDLIYRADAEGRKLPVEPVP